MISINKDFLAGSVVGFAAGIAVKSLPGQNQTSLRDAVKGTLKWGLSSVESARTQFAQLKEAVEDLVAEAKAESNVSAAEPLQTERPETEGAQESAPAPSSEKAPTKTKGQRNVA